jgi:hypothetical protein
MCVDLPLGLVASLAKIVEPGGCGLWRDTKGWSIKPLASASR